jgi:uncharacterized protein
MKYFASKIPLGKELISGMKPSEALRSNRDEVLRVVKMNNALNARVFGSVLHGKDTEGSDLDLLVDPTSQTSLLDIARIQKRLTAVLGVRVDVLTPKALPEKFRAVVLAEAQPV